MILHNYPNTILLDLDGTIADSLKLLKFSYKKFLNNLHLEASDTEFDSLNGPPITEVVSKLKKIYALKEDEHILIRNYFDIIDAAYMNVKPIHGASALLKKAHSRNCTVGVVTSNTKKRTISWLKKVNFYHMINFIVSSEDVINGKPNPEPYILAYKKSCSRIENIVVIEDSIQGASSAVDAGLRTLILTSENKKNWPDSVEPIKSLIQASKKIWEI